MPRYTRIGVWECFGAEHFDRDRVCFDLWLGDLCPAGVRPLDASRSLGKGRPEGERPMFSHMMVGSNDIARSKRFYDAVFGAIGGKPAIEDDKGRLIYLHND